MRFKLINCIRAQVTYHTGLTMGEGGIGMADSFELIIGFKPGESFGSEKETLIYILKCIALAKHNAKTFPISQIIYDIFPTTEPHPTPSWIDDVSGVAVYNGVSILEMVGIEQLQQIFDKQPAQ
jgi:hypothetical protein